MFDLVIQNILNRYSLKELSSMYKVDLPDFHKVARAIDGTPTQEIKAKYYEIINSNKLIKKNGQKVVLSLFEKDNIIKINRKMSFFEKMRFKIENFMSKMMSKIQTLNSGVSFIFTVGATIAFFPFIILNVLANSIALVSNAPGNIFVRLTMATVSLVFGLFFAVVGFILSPIINAFVDKVAKKDFIKKLVIGEIVNNNIINGSIYIPLQIIEDIEIDTKKNILGRNEYFVSLVHKTKTEPKVSIKDKLLSLFFTNYYINKRTVLSLKEEDKNTIEHMIKTTYVATNANTVSSLVNQKETVSQ